MNGKDHVRFLELVRDNIETHGLAWTLRYYSKRMPVWEVRFWARAAYLS